MTWNSDHDQMLLKEIRIAQPYRFKHATKYRGLAWEKVVTELNSKSIFSGKLKNKRAVRDRYNLLAKKYKDRIEDERRTGRYTQPTEASKLLDFITLKFDECDTYVMEKSTHEDLDREIANALKQKLMEETLKNMHDDSEEKFDGSGIVSENASSSFEREISDDGLKVKSVGNTNEIVVINGKETRGKQNGSPMERDANQAVQISPGNISMKRTLYEEMTEESLINDSSTTEINRRQKDHDISPKRQKLDKQVVEQPLLDLQLCLRREELDLKRKQLEMQTNVYAEIQKQQLILIQQQTQMFQQIHQQQLQLQQQLQHQQQQMIMQTKLMMTLVDRFCQHTSK